jgi:hypothetical protein
MIPGLQKWGSGSTAFSGAVGAAASAVPNCMNAAFGPVFGDARTAR